MSLDIRVNGYSIKQLLIAPPVITDSAEAACRTLEVKPQSVAGFAAYMGQVLELWVGAERWFIGVLLARSVDDTGAVSFKAYDPLYYTKVNPDDYFFKNLTATQIFKKVAENVGVRVGKLENTGAVLPALYYQGAEGDKVLVDALARTALIKNTRWWYRYNPGVSDEGLTMFQQKVPSHVWAFQRGVNLESANYSESIEETKTFVKLVNRETGKVVTRVNQNFVMRFGKMTHFEEVDKDKAANMESYATQLLAEKGVVQTTMSISGINPGSMGQFFSGDMIYVEEKQTKMLGGYYVRDVTQTFESGGVIRLKFELAKSPLLAPIQYEDATEDPNAEKATKSTKAETGVQQTYSAEMQGTLQKYDLDGLKAEAEASASEARDEALANYQKLLEENEKGAG